MREKAYQTFEEVDSKCDGRKNGPVISLKEGRVRFARGSRGADSVKLPRSMKIPTKAAALSLPMISLCFLTKLAL